MGKKLEELEVQIKADSSKYKQGMKKAVEETKEATKQINKEVEKAESPIPKAEKAQKNAQKTQEVVKKMVATINAAMTKIKEPMANMMSDNTMQQIRNMQSLMRQSAGDMKNGNIADYIKQNVSGKWKNLSANTSGYIKQAQIDSGMRTKTDSYEQVEKSIDSAEKSLTSLLNKQEQLKKSGADQKNKAWKSLQYDIGVTTKKLEELYAQEEKMSQGHSRDELEKSTRWKNLQNEISKTENAQKRYNEKAAKMKELGADQESERWKTVVVNIENADRTLTKLERRKSEMEANGTDYQFTGGLASGSYLETAGAVASGMKNSVAEKMREINSRVKEVIKSIPVVGRVATEAAYAGSKAFKGMKSVLEKVRPSIQKVSGVFGYLIQRFVSGIPIVGSLINRLKSTGNASAGMNNSLGGGIKTLLKYGLGIRSLFVLFNKLRTAMVDGFKNLAQYSDSTNQNLSTLQSGLNQLKNSLATAFTPILNVVTPILDTLINYAVGATNAIAQFFAALTGQSTYTVAKRVATDYAASLDKTASSADGANDSANQLKRTLMGFDEINKLDDNSSSGGSGGSGGGSGGSGAGDMFSTETVNNSYANFAAKIKEAWQSADFTEIGQIFGKKLNEALANIPWDDIKNTVNKIAKSIATFLNGFIEEVDWGLVGKTFAEGINTLIGFGYTFVTTFKWSKFGDAIADGINGFVDAIEWSKAGATFSEGIKGFLDIGIHAVENTDWKKLGESLGKMLNAVDWGGIIKKMLTGIGDIAVAIFDLLSSFIKTTDWAGIASDVGSGIVQAFKEFDWGGAFNSLGELIGSVLKAKMDLAKAIGEAIAAGIDGAKEYFNDKIEECGGNIPAGIFKGIKDGLSSIGTWIKENILDPFVNGFKDAFGIHSPSTVFAELGKYCIDGFLQGLANIGDAIAGIASSIWEALKTAWEGLGNALSVGVSLAKKGWSTISNFVGDTVKAFVSLAKKGWSTITSFVGSAVRAYVSLLKKGWSSITNFVGNTVKAFVSLAKKGWSSITNFVGNAVSVVIRIATKAKDLWSTFVRSWGTHTVNIYSKIATAASTLWNSVVSAWNSWTRNKYLSANATVTTTVHTSSSGGSYGGGGRNFAKGGIYDGSSWKPVTAAASGGSFSDGQMFVAREAGPEMVGTIGRSSAVVNNGQIVSSIAAGVYSAVSAALGGMSGKRSQPVINVYVGGKKVTDVVIEEVNNRTKSTGQCPILT